MAVINHLYAYLATIPFIPFFISYALLIYFGKSKQEAINISIYVTMIFLFGTVTGQIRTIFHVNGFWISLLWMLFIAGMLLFLQFKVRGNIDYYKVLLSTMKLSFLSFTAFYLIFFVVAFFAI